MQDLFIQDCDNGPIEYGNSSNKEYENTNRNKMESAIKTEKMTTEFNQQGNKVSKENDNNKTNNFNEMMQRNSKNSIPIQHSPDTFSNQKSSNSERGLISTMSTSQEYLDMSSSQETFKHYITKSHPFKSRIRPKWQPTFR